MSRDRRKLRYRAQCPAQILVPELSPAAATAIDLSMGGSFLETEAALPLGLRVKVRLCPLGRPTLVVGAKVLRVGSVEKPLKHPELDYLTVRALGMAVKFEVLESAVDAALIAYLETLPEL